MSDDVDGEVSIRQRGQVTAFDAPELDGAIRVDLDRQGPRVRVPADTDVAFSDPEGEAATDGGTTAARDALRIESRGWRLRGDHAGMLLAASVLAIGAGGWLFSLDGGFALAGLILLVLGAGAGYVGARSRWSGTREVERAE